MKEGTGNISHLGSDILRKLAHFSKKKKERKSRINRGNRDRKFDSYKRMLRKQKNFASYEIPTEINTVENCTQQLPFHIFSLIGH